MADLGFARYSGFGDIFKPYPIENILPGRKTVEQQL
jgi:ASC-1-like (ASCH) protein